jgi:hypothetical protein
MDEQPWQIVGGSIVLADGRVTTTPGACPEAKPHGQVAHDPEQVGECGSGCCDKYRCRRCGVRWTYEWPD